MKTKPLKFDSSEQFIELWQTFCDDIVTKGFNTIPSQTSFCRWLAKHYEKTDRKTIYNSLNKIFPNIKDSFDKIRADIIAEGTMLGKYQPTMSIFALKNWCKWADKQDVTLENKRNGQLADLIEGLKEDDLYTETETPIEAMADEQAETN